MAWFVSGINAPAENARKSVPEEIRKKMWYTRCYVGFVSTINSHELRDRRAENVEVENAYMRARVASWAHGKSTGSIDL